MTLTDIEKKVLLVAMDRAAATGEVQSASLKLVELLRKRYNDGHALIKDFESIQIVNTVRYIDNPYATFRMQFGKYEGEMLKDIPVDYLHWLLENFKGLRDSTKTVIESYLVGD